MADTNTTKKEFTPVTYDPQYILMVNELKKHFPIKSGMVARTIGHVKAVDGVTFNLRRGTTMGLVGESGCGKTTTGRTILRLSGEKTGGQVLFNGKEVYDLSGKEMRAMRTKMQIIFQDPFSSLSPRLPVGEIIGEAVREHGLAAKGEFDDYIDRIMDHCGLQPFHKDRYPHEFSGGQRQRICIARALALNPEFVVCDEPVSALDVSIQAQIINLLKDLQEKYNLTYLFISHDLSVVEHISDTVGVMYLGKGRLLVFFGAVMFFYCFMVDYVVAMALFVFVIPMGVVSVIGDRLYFQAIDKLLADTQPLEDLHKDELTKEKAEANGREAS